MGRSQAEGEEQMNNRHCEACGQVRLPRDVNHMNLVELEAMTLLHKQQIKDIEKHLLELKQSVTLMGRSREVVLQYG